MDTLKRLIKQAKTDRSNAWVNLFEREFVKQNGISALNCRFSDLKHALTCFAIHKTPQGSEFWLKIIRSLRKPQT